MQTSTAVTYVRYRPTLFVHPMCGIEFGKPGPIRWWIPPVKTRRSQAEQASFLRASVIQHLVSRDFLAWLGRQLPDNLDKDLGISLKAWHESFPATFKLERLRGIMRGSDLMRFEDLGWLLDHAVGLELTPWPRLQREAQIVLVDMIRRGDLSSDVTTARHKSLEDFPLLAPPPEVPMQIRNDPKYTGDKEPRRTARTVA
ncbi:MAG: hypothetical protein M0Z69_06930 [Actinomycetota bacterium]|nr:hypothetical protein [Actinomycetota bacterium]